MKLSKGQIGRRLLGFAVAGVAPYYCIARALELWFERLDFDAF